MWIEVCPCLSRWRSVLYEEMDILDITHVKSQHIHRTASSPRLTNSETYTTVFAFFFYFWSWFEDLFPSTTYCFVQLHWWIDAKVTSLQGITDAFILLSSIFPLKVLPSSSFCPPCPCTKSGEMGRMGRGSWRRTMSHNVPHLSRGPHRSCRNLRQTVGTRPVLFLSASIANEERRRGGEGERGRGRKQKGVSV